jgi:hypothetical protein
MKNDTKYVVAGNWNEFINYTKKRFDDDTMYIYVNNVDVMRGLNEISGVFIGTFHLRPDLEEIKWMIQNIKSRKRGFTAQTVSGLDPMLVSDKTLEEEILKESMKPINQLIPSEFIWKAIS